MSPRVEGSVLCKVLQSACTSPLPAATLLLLPAALAHDHLPSWRRFILQSLEITEPFGSSNVVTHSTLHSFPALAALRDCSALHCDCKTSPASLRQSVLSDPDVLADVHPSRPRIASLPSISSCSRLCCQRNSNWQRCSRQVDHGSSRRLRLNTQREAPRPKHFRLAGA